MAEEREEVEFKGETGVLCSGTKLKGKFVGSEETDIDWEVDVMEGNEVKVDMEDRVEGMR